MKSEKESKKPWFQRNKKKFLIAGTAVAVTVVGVVLYEKHKETLELFLKELLKDREDALDSLPEMVEEAQKPLVPPEILENLTGIKLTPSQLGDLAHCSAREINKRLVNSGLEIPDNNGGYLMTEAGSLVGENAFKTRAWGYSFSNIEWDKKILELLFSAEELAQIEEKTRMIQQIREELTKTA